MNSVHPNGYASTSRIGEDLTLWSSARLYEAEPAFSRGGEQLSEVIEVIKVLLPLMKCSIQLMSYPGMSNSSFSHY